MLNFHENRVFYRQERLKNGLLPLSAYALWRNLLPRAGESVFFGLVVSILLIAGCDNVAMAGPCGTFLAPGASCEMEIIIELPKQSVKVDMGIIATIESNNNPMAYNERTKATGMYQITPICLEDYNNHHEMGFKLKDMFIYWHGYKVADWYMNERIPAMLKHYGISDTIRNRLAAYNWGIGNVRRGKVLPKETRDYLKRYEALNNPNG